MKSKLFLFLLLGGGLLTVGAITINSISKQQQLSALENSRERGTLKWRVEVAKLKHQKQVVIEPPVPIYDVVNNVDEAFSKYLLVIAQPIVSKSIAVDDRDIWTWYKFRIIENLSHVTWPNPSTAEGVPEELGDCAGDEFLIRYQGGTLEMDGIKLSQNPDGMPPFTNSQQYLLFLAPDSSGKGVRLTLGPFGVFLIQSDGSLEPINHQRHPLTMKVEEVSGKSLYKLKAEIGKRK